MSSTGNPLGSSDSRDFYFNAAKLDLAMNDRSRDFWLDRFGVKRLSYNGMEKGVLELIQQVSGPSGSSKVGIEQTEGDLATILSSDSLSIKYGTATPRLKEKLGLKGARVVLVGDSLSSFFNIDSVNITSIFESYLRRNLLALNPSIDYKNRAIGGMRYYDLAKNTPALTAVNQGYPWYSDINRRWIDYIDDIKPDVVILAFGMNDGPGWDRGNFQQDKFFSMIEELQSISSNPELVFCTNILPSNLNAETSSFEQQQGRDAIAGWTRSYAMKNGMSFIDLHRRFKCIRDGVDPCISSYARKTIRKAVTLPYSYTDKTNAYSARVTLKDPAVAVAGINFQLSSYVNNFVNLKYNSVDQRWVCIFYTGTGSSIGIMDRKISRGIEPVEGTEIYFSLNGDHLTIMVGMNTQPVFDGIVLRFGGDFIPKIDGTGDVEIDLVQGTPIQVKSELTDTVIYNTDGDGGNGSNHPTALASSRLYGRVLDDWFESIGPVDVRHSVELDFTTGKLSVFSRTNPELNGNLNIANAITFIKGKLEYSRSATGEIQGALFGSTNQGYIDAALFNKYTGTYQKLTLEVEFITPLDPRYILSLGENATSDRVLVQVFDDNRPRVTALSATQTLDLFGPIAFPLIAGKRNKIILSLDTVEKEAEMHCPGGLGRGNGTKTSINVISSSLLSKIKFGYLTPTDPGKDIVISKVKLWFSN